MADETLLLDIMDTIHELLALTDQMQCAVKRMSTPLDPQQSDLLQLRDSPISDSLDYFTSDVTDESEVVDSDMDISASIESKNAVVTTQSGVVKSDLISPKFVQVLTIDNPRPTQHVIDQSDSHFRISTDLSQIDNQQPPSIQIQVCPIMVTPIMLAPTHGIWSNMHTTHSTTGRSTIFIVGYGLYFGYFSVDWLQMTFGFDPGPVILSGNATNGLVHNAQDLFDEMSDVIVVKEPCRMLLDGYWTRNCNGYAIDNEIDENLDAGVLKHQPVSKVNFIKLVGDDGQMSILAYVFVPDIQLVLANDFIVNDLVEITNCDVDSFVIKHKNVRWFCIGSFAYTQSVVTDSIILHSFAWKPGIIQPLARALTGPNEPSPFFYLNPIILTDFHEVLASFKRPCTPANDGRKVEDCYTILRYSISVKDISFIAMASCYELLFTLIMGRMDSEFRYAMDILSTFVLDALGSALHFINLPCQVLVGALQYIDRPQVQKDHFSSFLLSLQYFLSSTK